jgi:hypothetical protein
MKPRHMSGRVNQTAGRFRLGDAGLFAGNQGVDRLKTVIGTTEQQSR